MVVGGRSAAYVPSVDRSARRFGVPGGFSVVWLFGGALFLAVLAVAGVAGAVPQLAGPTVVLSATSR